MNVMKLKERVKEWKRSCFSLILMGPLTDRSTGQVVPSAKRALELLEEQGHFVSIATGRAHYKCRGLLEELGLENMVCSGGMGVVIKNKLVKNTPLDKKRSVGSDSSGGGTRCRCINCDG